MGRLIFLSLMSSELKCAVETIVITPVDRNYFIYRRQGVVLNVSSKSPPWWCFWCSPTTTPMDRIECAIGLVGLARDASAQGSCTNCGSLEVMGPAFWGVHVPQPYQSVTYSVVTRKGGQSCQLSDTELYPP